VVPPLSLGAVIAVFQRFVVFLYMLPPLSLGAVIAVFQRFVVFYICSPRSL
jgi:hypothetical protein